MLTVPVSGAAEVAESDIARAIALRNPAYIAEFLADLGDAIDTEFNLAEIAPELGRLIKETPHRRKYALGLVEALAKAAADAS